MKKSIVFSLMVALGGTLSAQQNNLLNTYSEDLFQLNPAASGLNRFEANLNYRNQWLRAKDNPTNVHLDVAAALGKNTGIGLKFKQQSLGLLSFTTVTGAYSYRLNFQNKSFLQLGAGLSFHQNTFRAEDAVVVDQMDASLFTGTVRSNNFDVEAGALFVAGRLKAGIGTQNLYNTNVVASNLQYLIRPQLNTHVSYVVVQKNKLEVEPWLVHRANLGGKQQVDVLVNARFNKLLMAGVGYRTSYGMMALAGVQLKNFRVYYSYDHYMANSVTNYGASHQIMLSYVVGKKKSIPIAETVKVEPTPVPTPEPVVEKPVEAPKEVVKVEEKPIEPQKPSIETLENEKLAAMNAIASELVFDVKQTTLPASANGKLDELATLMKADPSLVVNIQGYASAGGSNELNQELSRKRAEFIKSEMIKRGVSPAMFKQVQAKGTNTSDQAITIEKSRTIRFTKSK